MLLISGSGNAWEDPEAKGQDGVQTMGSVPPHPEGMWQGGCHLGSQVSALGS